jgi:rhodanese-related sulfurtransferase
MKFFATFLIVAALMFFYKMYKYAQDSPLRISSEFARELLKKKDIDVVLDVRTQLERDVLGYLSGSVHVPAADIQKIEQKYQDKSTKFLLYCNTGQRARKAAEALTHLGYKNVKYITGMHTSLY